jgi:hypothetical protein
MGVGMEGVGGVVGVVIGGTNGVPQRVHAPFSHVPPWSVHVAGVIGAPVVPGFPGVIVLVGTDERIV